MQLLKLSKAELIKRCKENGISIIGTKSQMVDRIIQNDFDLKIIQKKEKRTYIFDYGKNLVFGYLRRIQSTYNHLNIPSELIYMIVVFYVIDEKWSQQYKSKLFEIDVNIIKCLKNNYHFGTKCSAFLSNIICSGKHKWTFKILKHVNDDWLYFGIWCNHINITIDNLDGIDAYLGCIANTSYAFNINASVNTHEYDLNWNDYGEEITTGSIISMCVDFSTLTLSFIINGKDYKQSHNIKKCEYRAGISVNGFCEDHEIELLYYEQHASIV